MVETETLLILSMGKERLNKATMPHWKHKHKRPTTKHVIVYDLMQDTHLSEKETVTTLNKLEAEGKVNSTLSGGKQEKFFWWFLI